MLSINSKSRVQDSESICSFGFGYTKSILWLWVYSGYTRGLLWVYPGFTLGIFGYTCGLLCMYTLSILYSGYTWSIPWVYLGYAIGILWVIFQVYPGYTLDILWIYPGYTMYYYRCACIPCLQCSHVFLKPVSL